jgi:hypothetical protein
MSVPACNHLKEDGVFRSSPTIVVLPQSQAAGTVTSPPQGRPRPESAPQLIANL